MWKKLKKRIEGQSLVELALTLPVLLILLLGLVELGFALRAYLVLVNVNRETARFAARGAYAPQQIFNQARSAFGGQLPIRFVGEADPNAEVIVTYFYIPSYDDPGQPNGGATYSITTTGALTQASRLDINTEFQRLRDQNAQYNEDLGKTHSESVPVDHNVAIIEVFYYHKQVLVDAPVVSWIFPDTMALYSKTMMRIGSGRVY